MIKKDVVIVGAGPSGITAAIYLKRAGIDFAIIEKSMPGGKVALTSKVENYPSFNSIDGVELALKLQDQLSFNNIELTFDNIKEINRMQNEYEIIGDFDTYSCKYLIIASGTKERKLDLDKEDRFYGRGLSFCAICDGFLYKDKEVAVVGGGNSALEESLYLANICKKVHLIHRRNEFRGDEILSRKVKTTQNIEIHTPYVPSKILGDNIFEGLLIKNVDTSKEEELLVSSAFIYIGNTPNIEFIKFDLETKDGYILVDEDMKTSLDNVYAIGDVRSKKIRQIVTAVNDGAIAALAIEKEMKKA